MPIKHLQDRREYNRKWWHRSGKLRAPKYVPEPYNQVWNPTTKRFETVNDSKELQALECLRPPYVR